MDAKGGEMPIYEFRCTQCGDVHEYLLSGSADKVEMRCEKCGGEELERVLSRVSYVMGGGGGKNTQPSAVTKSCGPGKSCTSFELPGHTKS